MTTWKTAGLVLFAAWACAACGHRGAQAEPPEYVLAPANPYEEGFAKEDGVRRITWGGWIKTLTPGDGPSPTADSVVNVDYKGTLTDGTEFDSSYKRGRPAVFSLRNVVPCWTNGVPMMKVGEKAKLVCPASTAYGDKGMPPLVPGGATLVFEIELHGIMR
jgi:FKBP-type peptidyl-prolyl cis-trans isomerase FkpA